MTIAPVVPSRAAYRFISHALPTGVTEKLWRKPLSSSLHPTICNWSIDRPSYSDRCPMAVNFLPSPQPRH